MDSSLNLVNLHKKWQAKWEEANLFEPKAGYEDKFYVTAAFPYPNSPQHVGHARTYTTADIYARYMRMRGKNVLFPMAFHVTGTPIFAMAKRLEEQDAQILDVFEKIYHIPPEKAKTLTDPRELVLYFSKEIEAGMKEIGYSIDWRRKFFTFDVRFNSFITWQFLKLKQAGLIAKGKHPVPWCPKDAQAVGGHDTRGDVDPKLEEVITVLFKAGEGYIPTTTYRPETLPGVTNLWANPKANYVLAKFGDKNLYLSSAAFTLLCEQLPLQKIKDISAQEILALTPTHPTSGKSLPILPAEFVKEEVGTGLVMSVPAHAPFDFLALRDAGKLDELKPIPVLKTPGFGEIPAMDIVAQMHIASQTDEKAEEATKTLYKKEAHESIMLNAPYAGLSSAQAKEKISADLISTGSAFNLYVLANSPIYSRSGGLCTVKIVDNQWFIDYSNPNWKEKTRFALSKMQLIPPTLRKEFEYIIGWLEKKACTRAFGFGTRFPFDTTQLIEALSDSTIYMAYYTIAHITKDIDEKELTEEFFDYVFLSKIPNRGKISNKWDECKKEFEYWYPVDSRHSAIDLVTNHLPFYIFNHTAIFDSDKWPQRIVANGLVTMEGKKMSKSMGNILPLRIAINEYGPDVIRFGVTSTAEISADSDFSKSIVEGAISRLIMLHDLLQVYGKKAPANERDAAGKWFYSKFHSRIKNAKEQYENFELRQLSLSIFYETTNDLQWYLKRSKQADLREFFEYWTLLICPSMPHLAEEFWEILEHKLYVQDAKFASIAQFPSADEKQINSELDLCEEYVKGVREDILQIQKLIKLQENPKKIILIVHSPYKAKVRTLVALHKNMPEIMKAAKADAQLCTKMEKVSATAAKYIKSINKLIGSTMGAELELKALLDAKDFLSSEFGGAQVEIMNEEDAPCELAQKANNAQPNKPSIVIS
ncbi:MAG: leucine--tRNA ligase [Candidatus Micrarchaeia archaeon]